MKRMILTLLIVTLMVGCQLQEEVTETTRIVKEKYEQGGRYYVSVSGKDDTLIAVHIDEQEVWDQIKIDQTVTFGDDWEVIKVNWKELDSE